MATFYFTYSNSGSQPFRGGWTEVAAPDQETARRMFRAVHPDVQLGLLNCANVYDADYFACTKMPAQGNYGRWCWERLSVEEVSADGQ